MYKAIMALTILVSASAFAQNDKREIITVKSKVISIETTSLEQMTAHVPQSNIAGDLAGGLGDLMNPLNEAELVMDKIVNMGEKLWNVIQKGRPSINFKQATATALPQGVDSWMQMQGWKISTQTVKVAVSNNFGKTTSFTYKVIFAHNGNVNGVGKYIGYATVEPAAIKSEWLSPSLNAQVVVPAVFNMGSSKNPVAAMKIDVVYTFDNGLAPLKYVDSYIAVGNGKITAL